MQNRTGVRQYKYYHNVDLTRELKKNIYTYIFINVYNYDRFCVITELLKVQSIFIRSIEFFNYITFITVGNRLQAVWAKGNCIRNCMCTVILLILMTLTYAVFIWKTFISEKITKKKKKAVSIFDIFIYTLI